MVNTLYHDLTESLVQRIEEGGLQYIQRWIASRGCPINSQGKPYNGINTLLLWCSAEKQSFSADQWMTYKQASDLGGQVKKGEKGTRIVFYKTLEIDKGGEEPDKIPMLRAYTVFNLQQIDGLNIPDKKPRVINPDNRDSDLDSALLACGARVEHGGTKAFYRPSVDSIGMPLFEHFKSSAYYYATLAHELAHWTGHKDRLDRNKDNYATEELVAELSAAFTSAKLGLPYTLQEDAASYLASWLQQLKEKPKFLFQCAAAAQKATDYILNKKELNKEVKE